MASAMVALTILTAAQPAWSVHASRSHHATRNRHVAAAPQRQIACTIFGCAPVPPQCTPVEGRTPSGIPTGFDVIACRGR
jgi:hypothetical protein